MRFIAFGNGTLQALYDHSYAFYRRQLILTTKDRPADRVDDRFLVEKFKEEAEGIFLWMLQGLHRLIENNFNFTESEQAKKNLEEAFADSNNIPTFLESSGYIRFEEGCQASSVHIYTAYLRWCKDNLEKPLSANTFKQYLMQHADKYGIVYSKHVLDGKSYSNNYLEQKRVNNHDKSSHICVEGDFSPIVTPEEWYRAQEIKAGRVKESFSAKKGKKTTHCVQENRDLWGSRLRCTCGCGFRKNVWHKYDDKPNTYGYQCYNILNNGSANQRRKAGADDTGYCNQPMIADWKLELMGKKILELVFQDKRDLIDHTCDMIRKCLQTARPQGVTLSNIVGKMERIKFKKEMLLEMRTDGEITKQEFLDQRKKLDKELQELQAEYDSKAHNPVIVMDQPEWGKIQTALEEILDLSQPTPSPDLIRKFVAQIVPEGKTTFQWHLNLDGNQTTHVGVTVEGRKNKDVVSFATEGTCSPLAFGAVIEYPTLCCAASDKNAYLSAMQDRLLSRANSQ